MPKREEPDRKPGKEPDEQRELTFVTCSKHGSRYPKGGSCPQCTREARK